MRKNSETRQPTELPKIKVSGLRRLSQDECGHNVWPMVVYLPIVAIFVIVSIALYWPLPEMAFRSDNSPVSWLSSAQLWALAVIAIRLSFDRTLPLLLGLWLGFAMAAMAFDEQFMFHEQWKYGCDSWFSLCRFSLVREFPMLAVGACGFATALWLHTTVPNRLARTQLWSAIGIGLLALSMDQLHLSEVLAAYEEGFEVVAEAFFLSLLLGLRPLKKFRK